jgi:hypothetical protein
MRSAYLAFAVVTAVWLALGSVPVQAQTDGKSVSCQTCGKTAACPHCASGKDCPHCTEGKDCPHCKGKACQHCRKGHPHHGHWGAHKWEYKCVRPGKNLKAMTTQFSGLGAEGWRLVEADGGVWCFSRIRKSQ